MAILDLACAHFCARVVQAPVDQRNQVQIASHQINPGWVVGSYLCARVVQAPVHQPRAQLALRVAGADEARQPPETRRERGQRLGMPGHLRSHPFLSHYDNLLPGHRAACSASNRACVRAGQLSHAARSCYMQVRGMRHMPLRARCQYPARVTQPTLASHARASPLRRCSSRRSAAGLPSAR